MATVPSAPSPGGYQRYKNDTNAFLTWLLRAATSCGYQLDAGKAPSPPQKDSKVTLSVGGKRILVKDIIDQAKIVCSEAVQSCLLPRGVARLAERAIAARKKHSEHFEHRGEQASNHGHKHFTTTLSAALGMLQQHATKHRSKPEPESATETSNNLNNLFEHLDLEDCEDGDDSLDDFAKRVLDTTSSDTKKGGSKRADAVKDIVDTEDIVMRILFFFDGLQELRFQLTIMWKIKAVDPIAFAMAFNAALALAEQMEIELLHDLFPNDGDYEKLNFQFCGVKSAYSMITALLDTAIRGYNAADYGGYPFEADPAVIFTPINYFWSDVGMTLSKLSAALVRRKVEKKTAKDYLLQRELLGLEKAGCMVWPRVETMEMLFLTMCHDAEEVMATPEFEEEKQKDEALTAVLVDTFLRAEQLIMFNHHGQRAVHSNVFTRSILELADSKVGAAALLGALLVQEIGSPAACGIKADLYQPLRSLAEQTYGTIEGFKTDHKVLQSEGPRFRGYDHINLTNVGQLWYMVTDHKGGWFTYQQCAGVKQGDHNWRLFMGERYFINSFQHARMEFDEPEIRKRVMSLYQLKHQFMLPTADANRMWTNNALACGTTMLNMKLAYQETGICLANTQLSILAVAYMYTALKSSNLLQGTWKAMDALVDAHMGSLFFGLLPTDPKKRHGCWNLRIGNHRFLSKSSKGQAMATGGLGRDKAGSILPTSRAGPDCLALSDTSHLICEWFRDKQSMIKTVYAIHDVMVKKAPHTRKPGTKASELNPLSFLHDFATFIDKDIKRLDIDYIALTLECTALMQALVDNKIIEISPQNRGMPSKLKNNLDWMTLYMNETLENQPTSLLFAMECLLFADMCWFECKQMKKTVMRVQKKFPGFGVSELSPMEKVGEFVQKWLAGRDMLSPVEDGKVGSEKKERKEARDWELLTRTFAEGRVEDVMEVVERIAGETNGVTEATNSQSSEDVGIGKDFAKNLKGKWPTM